MYKYVFMNTKNWIIFPYSFLYQIRILYFIASIDKNNVKYITKVFLRNFLELISLSHCLTIY